MILSQIEFAYNRSMHQSVGMSPFEVLYGINLIGLLNLVPYPTKKQFSGDANERFKEIKKLHKLVRASMRSKMKGMCELQTIIENMWNLMWGT